MSQPQSTAYTATVRAYLSSDGKTPATGKTIPVQISKNGGAFGNPSAGAVNFTEIGNGWYSYILSTTDMNTVGDLIVVGILTGVDQVDWKISVVKATNGGFTALPDTAVTTNASLITSGTGTDQLKVAGGIADANVKQLLGTTWLTPGTAGTPDVNTKLIASQTATMTNVNGEYVLDINVIGYRGSVPGTLNGYPVTDISAAGALTNASTTTVLTLSVGLGRDNFGKGQWVYIGSGTGAGNGGINIGYVDSTKALTLDRALPVAPDNTSTYYMKIAGGPQLDTSLRVLLQPTQAGVTIPTVTTLTNLPAITTDWLTSAGVSAGAVTKIQSGLSTYAGGAVASVTGNIGGIAGVTIPSTIASPTNITAGTITTVTMLTNLPSVPTDWLTAAGVKADAVTKIQAGLATPTNIIAGTLTTVTNLTNLPAITTDWITSAGVSSAAVTKIQTGLATPTNITAGTIETVTNLTNAPTAGDFTAAMKLSLNAATPSVDTSGVAAAVATILFVDGSTNKLKVNTDHTVNATVSGTIQNNFTVNAPIAAAALAAATIPVVRGDALSVALPLLGDITLRTSLKVTFKTQDQVESSANTDTAAIIQIVEGTGLTRLNGSGTVTAGHASLTVTNATTGAVTLVLGATETAALALQDLVWDAQVGFAAGPYTPVMGSVQITADVTQAVT